MKVAAVKAPGGLDKMVIETRPDPAPGPGEVLVRVHASSLNYHDYAVVMGMIPAADGRIPMSDGAGEVAAVGAGVTAFQPGDKVMSLFFPNWVAGGPRLDRMRGVPGDHADGFAAELVAAPASSFTRIPGGWSFAEAATLPCAALTAWRALMVEARIKPGDVVLTQGTGGVSIFALQLAKAAGATVIATSSSAAKLQRLKALGADHLINYKEEADWGRAAAALTGGRGVDVVVEIGGAGTIGQSIHAVCIGGHISLIGILAGWAGEVPTALAMSKNVAIKGVTVGSREQQEEMIEALEANGIRPEIDSRFALDKIAEAFAHQASQKHFGKICLEF
jgi:NADPH:quinone reductase-like Zn-dependent oxidoreductase